jgi:hypothetical protein
VLCQAGPAGEHHTPDQWVFPIDGAMAFSLATRQTLVAQSSWSMLATNEIDDTAPSPRERLERNTGQKHAERGFRFVKASLWLASSPS